MYGVATYNGRTVKDKKIEIVNSMEKVAVNALALQETRRILDNAMWKVPGCVVFEHQPKKLEKGNTGITTMMSRDMLE